MMNNCVAGYVGWAEKAPYSRKVAKKDCIRKGLEFEADVQIYLDRFCGGAGKTNAEGWTHMPSKWIQYFDNNVRYAQPDSLLVNDALQVVIICEMKLKHTPRSIPQLLEKYVPLVQKLFPGYTVIPLEVYKFWDWIVYRARTYRMGNEWDLGTLEGCDIGLINLRLDEPLIIT